jgi:predicted metalloenzyme YecM
VKTIPYVTEEEEEEEDTSSGKSTTDSSRQAGMTKKGVLAWQRSGNSQKARRGEHEQISNPTAVLSSSKCCLELTGPRQLRLSIFLACV